MLHTFIKILALSLLITIPGISQSSLQEQETGSPQGKTVTLDNYFNHELRKDATGHIISFHYLWDDKTNSGFSLWGDIFRNHGLHTNLLKTAPTKNALRHSEIYIIVDPDTPAETPSPNYINQKDIKTIYQWVKKGGVLVLMANDSVNCEFKHLNQLAKKFGITFNQDLQNHVVSKNIEQGIIEIPAGNPVFTTAQKVYIKDLSSIKISKGVQPVLYTHDGNHIAAAVAHIGKGTVFAVGDPWFYNEYTNEKKLPKYLQNYQAADDLTKWLIKQTAKK